MDNYYQQMKIKPYPGRENTPALVVSGNTRALVACGVWLRAGFVGASLLLAGLMMLVGGEGNPALAMALVVVGGVLAPYAWRRSRAVLDRADAPAAKLTTPVPGHDDVQGFGTPVLR